jgi:hypothetical protein
VFVTVKLWDLLCPSMMLPKLKLLGEIESVPSVPTPLRAIANEEFPASLAMVIEPVALPGVDGANVQVSVTLDDGFTVAGVATPLILYALPVAETLERCTAALPVLVTTICWFALVPTAMFPKLMLAGVADNCPVGAEDPVPLNGMVAVGLFGSLLVMVTLPVAAAAVVGANVMVACTD